MCWLFRRPVASDPEVQSSEAGEEAAGHTAVPLIEERLISRKRVVETGRVRISVTNETAEDVVRETLQTRHAEVERVSLDREVTEVPQPRQEGDVLIIPVVEEILVIEKRLVLKEEIRLHFIDSETAVEQLISRRTQRANIERLPPQDASSAAPEPAKPIQGTEE
ncbi:YsnF/AvaK domain-containing protein [Pseudoroseomonas globiformis]|uniref:YsnF/AvaK domain-containing protein n=1 Tax=Teichococcus globiformis TaxID=2307229 RepID=A0ABV7FZ01_9PROT